MHGALHWWCTGLNIDALLAAAPEASIERPFRAAETRGAGRAAAQALLLCRQLLGTALSAHSSGRSVKV